MADWHVEWKWDGIRSQLIHREGRTFLWSRGEELVTDRFPEISALGALAGEGVAIDGEIFRGREGIEKYFGYLNSAWEKFHILRDGFRVSSDLVIMLGRLEGCGKVSGVPVDASLGMVFDFRGERISRIRGYLDHREALRAAGLAQ